MKKWQYGDHEEAFSPESNYYWGGTASSTYSRYLELIHKFHTLGNFPCLITNKSDPSQSRIVWFGDFKLYERSGWQIYDFRDVPETEYDPSDKDEEQEFADYLEEEYQLYLASR